MKLTFWGAARQVTGSMFMLELPDDYRILIDCGFDFETERQNRTHEIYTAQNGFIFPFEVKSINLVLLTHAHIDHSGQLPNLVNEGYEGQILCTAPTHDLSHILLEDSANIHKRKLSQIHKAGSKMSRKEILSKSVGLYTDRDAKEALDRFVTISPRHRFKVKQGLYVTFIPAGHLLGACSILIEFESSEGWKKIGFSGDLGRKNYTLLKDPEPFPEVDFLVCESTYGNRRHQKDLDPLKVVSDVVKRTCIDIPGRLIIPAFSIGRTQGLLYTLNRIWEETDLPRVKVFSDSPLAKKSGRIYEKYLSQLNQQARDFFDDNDSLFSFENLEIVEDLKRSEAISNYYEPCIIISSSGMVQGGRIEHHIHTNLKNPYATIFMSGYAAEGTLGRKLMDNNGTIRLGAKEETVLCNIEKTDVFSGHGDLDDLIQFIDFQSKTGLKKLFLVHGEAAVMDDFKQTLAGHGFSQTIIPDWGQTFELSLN